MGKAYGLITYDENVLALETWDLRDGSLHALRNFGLVLVDPGQVLCKSVIVFASHCRRITYKVAVAGLEGLIYGSANLAWRRLPGAKAQLAVYVSTTSRFERIRVWNVRNLSPSVELDSLALVVRKVGHCCCVSRCC